MYTHGQWKGGLYGAEAHPIHIFTITPYEYNFSPYFIIINCFTVQQNKQRTEDNELKTSEVLMVCQQHVLIASIEIS